MPRNTYRSGVVAKALNRVANVTQQLGRRFPPGLALFNAVRSQLPGLPLDWYSRGYQLGRALANAVGTVAGMASGQRPLLRDIPIVSGLVIGDRIDNRILYRFRVRLFEKYGRVPKTFIVDITSNKPLDIDTLLSRAQEQAEEVYADSPRARRGGNLKDIREIQTELISVARRY